MRPLRFWLSFGLSSLVAIAILLVILVVLGVLVPRLKADVAEQNRILSIAAAKQIDSFLEDFSSAIGRLGEDIAAQPALKPAELRLMVDAVANADKGIESIYVIDEDDRVIEAGLHRENRTLRPDQIGIDFSGRPFLKNARTKGQKVWSDTYLSARGNIVVALAIPLSRPASEQGDSPAKNLLVGELNLHEVSRFAGLLGNPDQMLTIIVDRRGNIVGHPDAERALRQENIGAFEPLDPDDTRQQGARFRFDGMEFLGSISPISETGWTALVGQPTVKAFAIVRSTLFWLSVSCTLALFMAIIVALVSSRRIMKQVDSFREHVAAVASGCQQTVIPKSDIDEIEELSRHLQGMARTVLEREARLRESETSFRLLIERVPHGIALIAPDERVLLVNASFTQIFGLTLDEIPQLSAWWQRACPEPGTREKAIRAWKVLTDATTLSGDRHGFLHLCRKDGEPRDIEIFVERLPDARILATLSDITERRQNEARLQRAAKVFSHAREGIIISDAKGAIVEVNDTFRSITGYRADEVVGKSLRVLRPASRTNSAYTAMWKSLFRHGNWQGELWLKTRDGTSFAALANITAVCDTAGQVQNYVSLFTDITQMKAYQRQLEHVAHYDPLTGLPNRVLLADRLKQAMSRSLRRGLSLAVLYLDLDGFKSVNDRFGHDFGDKLLLALTQRLKEALRDSDTISRIGGDEFVAVLADLTQEQDCQPILHRMLAAAADPLIVEGIMMQVSASIGVTFFPQDDSDAEQLLRHADQAMYQAKQAGKNRYGVFDIALDAANAQRHKSVAQIRDALERNQFVLYYQPKVNLRTGAIIGAEGLIRWQHPERGLLLPADFLPLIEDHPVSIELGEWVIETALAQLDKWRKAGLTIPISINIGARQLLRGQFDVRLEALLARYPDVPPDQLELEILETSALEDLTLVSEIMLRCLDLGVVFSIDDFGTGYSSLTYLKRLPAQTLKIDRSFVRDMLSDPDDLAIIEGIIGLATTFRREVIAEGVETEEHGSRLLHLGCSLAQGYGISRPLPAEQLPAWIAAWRPFAAWSSSDTSSVDDRTPLSC